ncbi:hypothetical protein FE257_002400 [Aspergillus nanangensis]|uniref:Grh/CP2 DB domain-containing protein n=1 Tax=Aspergillus nanangensis TaxID=2582783 RepID=A0AAD4CE08_ASPNN|nr:hypothetical protein FE257_002400 [Aspergillus nanangensis]
MIRKRRNSQKPDYNFVEKFRRNYGCIVSGAHKRNVEPTFPAVSVEKRFKPTTGVDETNLKEAVSLSMRDLQLTPSIDPSSLSFSPLSNLPPNSHGMWNVFHSQAGDLHTPTMKLDPVTPLSLTTAIAGAPANNCNTPMFLDHFNQQYLWGAVQNVDAYSQHLCELGPLYQPDSGYGTLNESVKRSSSVNDVDIQGNAPPKAHGGCADYPEDENLRFKVALHAQTAMVKHRQDIPVTYLNKGQPYLLSVLDSNPSQSPRPVKYRTYIRVSFDEEEQKVKPVAYWELWRETRGLNEARQRGSKLLAVEYVDPSQDKNRDQNYSPIQLEHASVDGFSVTWTADPAMGEPQCTISARFNFLSTDFNIAKGVRGITVTLCAKTQVIPEEYVRPNMHHDVEVCYCKIKLFRDHGAERKLHNDIAHVKKAVEKINQSILLGDTEGSNSGKQKKKKYFDRFELCGDAETATETKRIA